MKTEKTTEEKIAEELTMDEICHRYHGCRWTIERASVLEQRNLAYMVIDGIIYIHLLYGIPGEALSVMVFTLYVEIKKCCKESFYCAKRVRILTGKKVNKYIDDFILADCAIFHSESIGYEPMEKPPQLVIEIASEYKQLNMEVSKRREIYEEMGVPEYWVWDLNKRCVVQYHMAAGGKKYNKHSFCYSEGVITHRKGGLKFNLNLSSIFDEFDEIMRLIETNNRLREKDREA